MLSQEEAASYQDDIGRRRMDALTTTSAHIPNHQKFWSRTLPLRRDIRDTHHPRPRAHPTPPPLEEFHPRLQGPLGLESKAASDPSFAQDLPRRALHLPRIPHVPAR